MFGIRVMESVSNHWVSVFRWSRSIRMVTLRLIIVRSEVFTSLDGSHLGSVLNFCFFELASVALGVLTMFCPTFTLQLSFPSFSNTTNSQWWRTDIWKICGMIDDARFSTRQHRRLFGPVLNGVAIVETRFGASTGLLHGCELRWRDECEIRVDMTGKLTVPLGKDGELRWWLCQCLKLEIVEGCCRAF